MSSEARIVLASASPRRHELLAQLGVRFRSLDAGIDEGRLEGERPAAYAERLAREKALEGWRRAGRKRPTLGADTIVVLQGEIMLKPESARDAVRMLQALSGCRHTVISSVALAQGDECIDSLLNRTEVTFSPIPKEWIECYAASGEPRDKAGAYAVQGRAARWVKRIDGSFSGVMGLPLFETSLLLERAGVLS